MFCPFQVTFKPTIDMHAYIHILTMTIMNEYVANDYFDKSNCNEYCTLENIHDYFFLGKISIVNHLFGAYFQ